MHDTSEPAPGGQRPRRQARQVRSGAGFSRRDLFRGAGGLAAGGALAQEVARAAQEAERAEPQVLSGTVRLELEVNGEARAVEVEPRTTLLDALRVHLEPAVTGPKLVCGEGACGACTVLLDGEPVYACLQLAADAVGRRVTTVEGLAPAGRLSPVQEAFCAEDALMCGFCTPGFVTSLTACLARDPRASDEDVLRALSGNLCRCGTYPQVFAAARSARERIARQGGGR